MKKDLTRLMPLNIYVPLWIRFILRVFGIGRYYMVKTDDSDQYCPVVYLMDKHGNAFTVVCRHINPTKGELLEAGGKYYKQAHERGWKEEAMELKSINVRHKGKKYVGIFITHK